MDGQIGRQIIGQKKTDQQTDGRERRKRETHREEERQREFDRNLKKIKNGQIQRYSHRVDRKTTTETETDTWRERQKTAFNLEKEKQSNGKVGKWGPQVERKQLWKEFKKMGFEFDLN